MASVLDRLPPRSAIAVIRLRSLGDCVLTTPALAILQNARPDLRIAVVVEDRFREIFEGIAPTLPPSLAALRRWAPRLCLNLHGGTRSALLTALSGAKFRAGFAHYRHQAVYNVHIPRAQEILHVDRKVHTAEHLASAMFYLGAKRVDIPRAHLVAPLIVPPRPYAVIHPVAAKPEKTWPAPNFLAVADRLLPEPVFIGAAHDDLSPFAAHRIVQGASLTEIKSLIAAASLFIGNDSGPAHIAAAFGVPSVLLFGPSDPHIWGPWRNSSVILSMQTDPAELLQSLAALRS